MKLIIVKKGGSGSGDFGHSGRPGEVGGSSGGHGSSSEKILSTETTRYGSCWRKLKNLSKDTTFFIIDKGDLSPTKLSQAAAMRTEYDRIAKSFPVVSASGVSEVHLQSEEEHEGEKFAQGVTGVTITAFGTVNIHAQDDAPVSDNYILGRKGNKGQSGVVDASLTGAFRHEIGHMVAYSHEQTFAEFKGIVTKLGRTYLGKNVSTYGSKQGADELFAEAFSAFTHTNYSGDLPKEIDDLFHRTYR
jgi:hypothetical protein